MTTPILTLSPAEKQQLKAQAHALDPVVAIGDKGLSPSVLKEVEVALAAHGLIKVRVHGDDRDTRLAHAQALCQATGAALVQHIGKLLVLYRSTEKQAQEKVATKTDKPRVGKRQTKRAFVAKNS